MLYTLFRWYLIPEALSQIESLQYPQFHHKLYNWALATQCYLSMWASDKPLGVLIVMDGNSDGY